MLKSRKKLKNQTLIITGASSGIGLATARLAAQKGAQVVLTSRNESALKRAVNEIRARGGRAIAITADVSDPDQVQSVADAAIAHFGGFDTWINNAGTTIFGKLTEVEMAEKKRLFDTNFWGVVNGCRSAVKHFKSTKKTGTLINLGSVVSDRAIPLQGIYSASKHAIKAYTDTLRMELEHDGIPIAVSLIKPGTVDTPFFRNAANHMRKKAVPPSKRPYSPETVARAILTCAVHPKRDIFVGSEAKMISTLSHIAPRWVDRYLEKSFFDAQHSDEDRISSTLGNLYRPVGREGRIYGNSDRPLRQISYYTQMSLHPKMALALGVGFVLFSREIWKLIQKERSGIERHPEPRPAYSEEFLDLPLEQTI